MSNRFNQLGVAPIECGWDNPQCLGQVSWGYGIQVPAFAAPPPMQIVNIGYQPISDEPVASPVSAIGVTTTPVQTLPAATDPAASIWQQPVSTETLLLIGVGAVAVMVLFSKG